MRSGAAIGAATCGSGDVVYPVLHPGCRKEVARLGYKTARIQKQVVFVIKIFLNTFTNKINFGRGAWLVDDRR